VTFNLPIPPQFAGSFIRRFSRIACSSLMLLAFAAPLPAVDMLYVTLNNNTIVTYDTSSGNAATITASLTTFANSNLSSPKGLAFDTSGNLYAANAGDSTISKFNSSGAYVSSGSIPAPLSTPSPHGLAFDSSGNLYVAYYSNNTISKFDASGAYVSNITTNLNGPYGLAFDSSGNLYASNINNNTISKFDASGAYISNISSNMSMTLDLAFDSSGNLYASNKMSSTISKFNSSGAYVSLGSIPATNLSGPAGLAFDTSGNLYAANSDNRTISKFDSSGTFLTSWSTGILTPEYLAFKPVSVPEPSTYALATIATGVMAYLARRRKARTA
jgi:tripartite motif-containing protein 71